MVASGVDGGVRSLGDMGMPFECQKQQMLQYVEKNRRPHLVPSRARARRADGEGEKERESESVLTPSTPHQLLQPVSAVYVSHLVLRMF